MEAAEFERRFLAMVFGTETPITVGTVAFTTGCSLQEAASYLESFAKRGIITMDVNERGDLVYDYPGRLLIRSAPQLPSGPGPLRREATINGNLPALRTREQVLLRSSAHPGTAAVLSFFWPGIGHIYAGDVPRGLLWMLGVFMGYVALIVPGMILHVLCIISSARLAEQAALPPAR